VRKLIVIIGFLSLFSCSAFGPLHYAHGGRIISSSGDISGNVTYNSYKFLLNELYKRATNEMLSSDEVADLKADIPIGGEVEYYHSSIISGYSIKMVIKESEKLIAQTEKSGYSYNYSGGFASSAGYIPGRYTFSMTCEIPQQVHGDFTVYIIDKVRSVNGSVVISPVE
jgi:hypothetical protein